MADLICELTKSVFAGASMEEDPIYRLKKLNQNGSIKDYYEEFRSIQRCVNLPEEFFISWFIAGLKMDTREEVQSIQPRTVLQAFAYGRLYELVYPKGRPLQSDPTPQLVQGRSTQPDSASVQSNQELEIQGIDERKTERNKETGDSRKSQTRVSQVIAELKASEVEGGSSKKQQEKGCSIAESTKKAKTIITQNQEINNHPVSVKDMEPEIGGLSQNDQRAPAFQQPMVQLQRSDKQEKVFLPKTRSTSIEISSNNRPNNGVVGDDFKRNVSGIAYVNLNSMVQDQNIFVKQPEDRSPDDARSLYRGIEHVELELGSKSNARTLFDEMPELGYERLQSLSSIKKQGIDAPKLIDEMPKQEATLCLGFLHTSQDDVGKVLKFSNIQSFVDHVDAVNKLIFDPGGRNWKETPKEEVTASSHQLRTHELIFGEFPVEPSIFVAECNESWHDLFGNVVACIDGICSELIRLELKFARLGIGFMPYDRGKFSLIKGRVTWYKFSLEHGLNFAQKHQKFLLLTRYFDGEILRGSGLEFIAILLPYDRGKFGFILDDEEELLCSSEICYFVVLLAIGYLLNLPFALDLIKAMQVAFIRGGAQESASGFMCAHQLQVSKDSCCLGLSCHCLIVADC